MSKTKDGGPAFPTEMPYKPGMSLRDWFAGQALAGLLPICVHDTVKPGEFPQHIARNAYQIADAMLATREAGR